MTNIEAKIFINTMADYGDFWSEQQVMDFYGNTALEHAIESRKANLNLALQNIASFIK